MTLTREEILARKLTGMKTQRVTIEGVGEVVVRGLTRNEALALNDVDNARDRDNLALSSALVEPRLSPDEVDAWASNEEAGVLTDLIELVAELSGMAEGAGKSRVSRARRKS